MKRTFISPDEIKVISPGLTIHKMGEDITARTRIHMFIGKKVYVTDISFTITKIGIHGDFYPEEE